MKRIIFISLLVAGIFTASQVAAQSESQTTKTATKKHGYTIINQSEPITIYKYVHAAHSP